VLCAGRVAYVEGQARTSACTFMNLINRVTNFPVNVGNLIFEKPGDILPCISWLKVNLRIKITNLFEFHS